MRINLLRSRIRRPRESNEDSEIRPLSEDLPRLINPEPDEIRIVAVGGGGGGGNAEGRAIGQAGYSGIRGPTGVAGVAGFSGVAWGFSGYPNDREEREAFERCYINPKIHSPQEIEHLPRLKILELLIKAVGDERLSMAVLSDYERTVGFKLSDEAKDVLYCYYDPEYKPQEKKAGRMIRMEE